MVCDQEHPNVNLEAGTREYKFQMLMKRVVCPQLQQSDLAIEVLLYDTLSREFQGLTPHFILT